jgi:hypothetical protein
VELRGWLVGWLVLVVVRRPAKVGNSIMIACCSVVGKGSFDVELLTMMAKAGRVCFTGIKDNFSSNFHYQSVSSYIHEADLSEGSFTPM